MTGHLVQTDLARMNRSGVAAISNDQALALFDAALGGRSSRGRAGAVRPGRAPRACRRRAPAAGAAAASCARPRGPPPADGSLAARLAGLPPEEQDRVVGDVVREQIATVLAHPSPETIELGRAFQELGFDSLTALDLRNRLGAATGVRVPATVVFDHPTPEALIRFLRTELLEEPAAPRRPGGDRSRGRRRPHRDRRDGLPLSGRRGLAGGAVGAGRRRRGRGGGVPRRPRLEAGRAVRPRSGPRRAPATPTRAASCTTRPTSTRRSSASARARP